MTESGLGVDSETPSDPENLQDGAAHVSKLQDLVGPTVSGFLTCMLLSCGGAAANDPLASPAPARGIYKEGWCKLHSTAGFSGERMGK